MSGRARLPLSHGLGGSMVAHAESAAASMTMNAVRMQSLRFRALVGCGGDERRDALLEAGLVLVQESALHEGHLALRVDEVGARHALDAPCRGCRAGLVVHDRELRRDLGQEFVGIRAL